MTERKENSPSRTTTKMNRERQNRWHKEYKYKPTAVLQTKFTGGKEELDGHHDDNTEDGQSDRYSATKKKIATFVGQEFNNGGTTHQEVVDQTKTVIAVPDLAAGAANDPELPCLWQRQQDKLPSADGVLEKYPSTEKDIDESKLNVPLFGSS